MKIILVLPVYNEASVLERHALALRDFCASRLKADWLIILSDNASTDETPDIGQRLAETYENIRSLRLTERGKGRAIREAWNAFPDADVFAFMDADLSTDLEALPALLSAVSKEDFDLALGSRALPQSRVSRRPLRRIISSGYRLLSRLFFHTRLTDLPCGFKAISKRTLQGIVPLVENNEWFFDSELVLIAEHLHRRIKEIPVVWKEGLGRRSKVSLISVVINYLDEMRRLKKTLKRL